MMATRDFNLFLSSDSDECTVEKVIHCPQSAKTKVQSSKIKNAEVKRTKKTTGRKQSTKKKKTFKDDDDYEDDSSSDFDVGKQHKKSKDKEQESYRPVEAFKQCFPLIPLGKPIAARPQYCQPDSSAKKIKPKPNLMPLIKLIRLEDITNEKTTVEEEDDDSSDVEIIEEIIVSKEAINQYSPDKIHEVKSEEIEIPVFPDDLPDIISLSESEDEYCGDENKCDVDWSDGVSQLKIMSVEGDAGMWFS